MANPPSGIMRRFFRAALDDYFCSDYIMMANTLECTVEDIKQALSRDSARIDFTVFERLLAYCLQNELSIDRLLRAVD